MKTSVVSRQRDFNPVPFTFDVFHNVIDFVVDVAATKQLLLAPSRENLALQRYLQVVK